MSFLLTCPNCGKRNVAEFSFRGEYRPRPAQHEPFSVWADYVFFRHNRKGVSVEWWFHRTGCQRWFLVKRDSANNTDHKSYWFKDRERTN